MAYEKLLNEIYAVVSLKYLWADYEPYFVKSESPDWINPTMDLGLEVSQALMPEDGKTEMFIEKYLGCLKEELPKEAVEYYGDRLHFYNGRCWAVLPEPGAKKNCMRKAKYRFDRKLEKLNTNYQKRKQNGLYLFLHPSEEEEVEAKKLFSYMKRRQQSQKEKFDWVFLNCGKVIYVCNFQKDLLESIVLPQNAESFLNTESEYLRYLGTWENGTSLDDLTENSSL